MSLDRFIKYEYLILFFIYLIAHGLILTCNGIFWDDWVLYDVKSDAVIDIFRQAGAIWAGYLHVFLLGLPKSIFFYRLLVFLSFMFSGVFLNEILKKITEIDNFSRFIIVIFFLVFPVNSARIALICTPYALCHFSFFFASWIIIMFPGRLFFRLLGLCLFFFSFTTNSLLVYYLLFLIFTLYSYCGFSFKFSWSSIKKYLLRNIDLLMLPVLFWIIKSVFFRPYSLYQGVNAISIINIIWTPYHFYNLVLKSSFFDVIRLSLDVFNNHIVVTSGTTLMLWIILKRFKYIHVDDSNGNQLTGIFAGIFIFYLGVFPYLAVGKVPYISDWESRHQLLVPLGVAIILCYVSKFFFRREVLLFVLSFIIAIFIVTNISSYIAFQRDWYKQLSLIENFKLNEIIRSNTTFLMSDETLYLNANRREYRFYEYTGLMKKAFKNEKRFAVNERSYKKDYGYYSQFISDKHNLADYIWKEPEYRVNIKHGTFMMSYFNVAKLRFYEMFGTSAFMPNIKNILKIDSIKITTH